MTDDFALYETRYAESMLGGGYPCFFCGINGPEYSTRQPNDLLCEECSERYETKAGHKIICPLIQKRRSRRRDDLRWDSTNTCWQCRK